MKILLFLALMASILFLAKANSETMKKILSQFESGPKKELFKVYHFLYKKEYDLNSEEGLRRYKIFKENLEYIRTFNAEKHSYFLAINDFADLTNEEYRKKMLMSSDLFMSMKERALREVNFDKEAENEELPEIDQAQDIDWKPIMLPARAQGTCNSCWAFSTAATLEGGYAIKQGKKVEKYLSPQHLVDCNTGEQNGCNGGWPLKAMLFTYYWGLCTEESYPYSGVQGYCRAPQNQKCHVVNARGFDYCSPMTYHVKFPAKPCTLNYWLGLLSKGPVVVCMDGNSRNIQFYGGGIIENIQCSPPNHAVVAVSWSKDQVITVRNSWGTKWGENGHFRVRYQPYNENTCYITAEAILPLF